MKDRGKIFTDIAFVIGIAIVGFGCHAYFESPWNKAIREPGAYEICNAEAAAIDKKCPRLSLETYFIAISIITLILSVVFTVIRHFAETDFTKRVEQIYNFHAGILIFIGGLTLLASALLIYDLQTTSAPHDDRNSIQYFDEKITAAILSLINGLTYFAAWLMKCNFNQPTTSTTTNIPYTQQKY